MPAPVSKTTETPTSDEKEKLREWRKDDHQE
jgi:hypothetical protein